MAELGDIDLRTSPRPRDRLHARPAASSRSPIASPGHWSPSTSRRSGLTPLAIPPVASLKFCLSRQYSTTTSPGRSPPRLPRRRSRSPSSDSTDDDELNLTLGAINLVQPSLSTAGSTPHPRAHKRQRADPAPAPPSEAFIPISCEEESCDPPSPGSPDIFAGPSSLDPALRSSPLPLELPAPVLDPQLRSLVQELAHIYRLPTTFNPIDVDYL